MPYHIRILARIHTNETVETGDMRYIIIELRRNESRLKS